MRTMTAIVLFALAGAVTPAYATDPDLWERTVPLSGRATVHVITDDGRVRVGAWDRHEVGIRVTTRGWRINDRGVRVSESHEGDHVTLEVREPHFQFNFGIVLRSILVEVWVPRSADLAVQTGDGDVSIPAMEGRLDVTTGDGDISINAAKGAIHLRTGDGRIVATGLDGTLEARTGDGSVRIDGRFDALGLSSGDGNISAEVASGSRLSEAWSVVTGDGRVTLLVPPDLKAQINAHTGDGGITIDLPITVSGTVNRHDVHGTLNGGGPPLTLRTGDGSIHIAPVGAVAR
jgi:DUF4097 and DUF4098 domain-containing protein YvlB